MQDGITPAYAGKSPGPGSGRSAFRDHPRVCGEKEFSRLTSKPGLGSPPRMRGKGLAGREAGRQGGITPAYAGKSSKMHFNHLKIRDHPRVCGEKLPLMVDWYSVPGSPPRMRGKESPRRNH